MVGARALGQFALAVVIAAALWSPYLLAKFSDSAADNGGPVAELKRRVLYQTQFTAGKRSIDQVALRNFNKTFVPSHRNDAGEEQARLTAGWMFVYLTPAIYFACVLGIFYLAVRGEWLAFFFLLTWLALMLGPPIVMGNVIFSRYVLAGVPPLLITGAYLLADVMTWMVSRRGPAWVTWSIAALLLAGLLAAPLKEIGAQTKYWPKQTLTAQDHYQYITGWTSGTAVRAAIRDLLHTAKNRPLVVITDAAWGNPADAAWVYLSDNPNIALYYRIPQIDGPVVLKPAGNDPQTVLLRKDKFLFHKPEIVRLDSGVPVFLLANDPVHTSTEGDVPADEFFRRANPNLGPQITFYGVDVERGEERVILIPLR
jgi:hypothetical protein